MKTVSISNLKDVEKSLHIHYYKDGVEVKNQ